MKKLDKIGFEPEKEIVDLISLKNSLDEEISFKENLLSSYETTSGDVQGAKRELHEAKSDLTKKTAKIKALDGTIQGKEEEIVVLNSETAEIIKFGTEEKNKIKGEVTEMKASSKNAKDELSRLSGLIKQKETEHEEKKKSLKMELAHEKKKALSVINDKVSAKNSELTNLTTSCGELEETQKTLELYIAKLTKQSGELELENMKKQQDGENLEEVVKEVSKASKELEKITKECDLAEGKTEIAKKDFDIYKKDKEALSKWNTEKEERIEKLVKTLAKKTEDPSILRLLDKI